jgi:CHASE3 domain sensor protein
MRRQRTSGTTVGFSLAIVCLIVAGAASYRALVRFDESSQLVVHTLTAEADLQNAAADLSAAEKHQRPYLLTGNRSYLTSSTAAAELLKTRLAEVKELVADNPAQTQRIANLQSMVARRLDLLREGSERRERDGLEAGIEWVRSGQGQQLSDEILSILESAEAEEAQLLSARSDTAKATSAMARVLLLIGGLLSIEPVS